MTRDIIRLAPALIVGVVILTIVLVIPAFMFEGVRLPLMDMRRENIQHSQQYVESQQQHLFTLANEYRDNEGGNNDYLVDQMEQTAEKIPADEVPAPVVDILKEHGRWNH